MLRQVMKVKLQDQFQQCLLSTVYNSPKGLNYRLFKDTLEYESYFNILKERDFRFRTTNHQLYQSNADASAIYKGKIEFVHYDHKMKLAMNSTIFLKVSNVACRGSLLPFFLDGK